MFKFNVEGLGFWFQGIRVGVSKLGTIQGLGSKV